MWQEEKGQGIEFTNIQKKKQQSQVFFGMGEILCPKLFIGKYAYILPITESFLWTVMQVYLNFIRVILDFHQHYLHLSLSETCPYIEFLVAEFPWTWMYMHILAEDQLGMTCQADIIDHY